MLILAKSDNNKFFLEYEYGIITRIVLQE